MFGFHLLLRYIQPAACQLGWGLLTHQVPISVVSTRILKLSKAKLAYSMSRLRLATVWYSVCQACQLKWGSLGWTISWINFENPTKTAYLAKYASDPFGAENRPPLKLKFRQGLFSGPKWSESYLARFGAFFVFIFMYTAGVRRCYF